MVLPSKRHQRPAGQKTSRRANWICREDVAVGKPELEEAEVMVPAEELRQVGVAAGTLQAALTPWKITALGSPKFT